MTKKKNINNVKFLKKIVKKKEREDKEWHPAIDTDFTGVDGVFKSWLCGRHNE